MQLCKPVIITARCLQFIFLVICALFIIADMSWAKPGYCQEIRSQRQRDINNNPEIKLKSPLVASGKSNCFSPAENLYFVSLIETQKTLEKNAKWYDSIIESNKDKAEMGCKVMGYGEGPMAMSLEKCIGSRFDELMIPYKDEYQKESARHIAKRNTQAEKMVTECVTAFHQSLPKLPKRIQFPLAYYDKKLRAYPGWFFESKIDNNNWIENMHNTYASSIVKEALINQCPGDMVYWLYL